MIFQKSILFLCILIGVAAVALLGSIIISGDESIKMAALSNNFSKVSPLILLAQIVLFLTLGITLLFVIKDLFYNRKKLKKTLLFLSIFGGIVLISFLASSGGEVPLKDGKVLSSIGSRWVGTGLRTFYFLAIIATGSMLFFSLKRSFFNK